MRSHGAIIVDQVNITDVNYDEMVNDWWSLFMITFPEDMANYLAELSNTTMRTLADLIAFNLNHTDQEFHPQFAPNQRVFEWSNEMVNLSYANQSSLLNKTQQWSREFCIDAA